MAMKSMTGFGRAEGSRGPVSWVWEARSVNGRSLDVRLRLPPGYEQLEPKARELISARLSRGNVSVSLAVKRIEGAAEIRLNPSALSAVASAVEAMRAAVNGPTTVNIDGLLALRGVLDTVEPIESEAEADARSRDLLATLSKALAALADARAAEGARLADVLAGHIAEIERLVAFAAKSPARAPAAIAARLKEQLDRLLGQAGSALDPQRLHQEAALLATRGDIEEEITRLTAHIAQARDLIASKDAVGRKFDFLTQEFNREANTLCSKSSDVEMTRAGLDLKAAIDQLREQVQNIE